MKINITQVHIDRWMQRPTRWTDLFEIALGMRCEMISWMRIRFGDSIVDHDFPPACSEWMYTYRPVSGVEPISFTVLPHDENRY